MFSSESAIARTTIEYTLPAGPWQWLLYGGGFALIFAFAVWIYLRDTTDLARFWKVWLSVLRIGTLVGLVVIAINPQERTQKMSYRPSRVAVLVDTSFSMRFPETTPTGTSGPAANVRTRADAVQQLLADTTLIKTLRENHDVSVYTFDSTLAGPHMIYRTTNANVPATTPTVLVDEAGNPLPQETANWEEIVRPRGLETRLGESLLDLVRQVGGRTLAGIVLVTDGGANAGVEPTTAQDGAKAAKARLITVGVGSTEPPVNLQIVNIQAPTDVHVGDAYEIAAFVQSQGLAGRDVEVELLAKPAGIEGDPTLLETRTLSAMTDAVPTEVKFERLPDQAGGIDYVIRARTSTAIAELSNDDNEVRKTINVVDRKTRVLLVAGGPMRDYRFVRNMLYRHSAIEVDVWLQSSDPGGAVSQDSDRLLIQFPANREELANYDVIIAFDPDWRQIPAENIEMLSEWVYRDSGGIVLIAGDVFTEDLASATEELQPILELYPVVLSPYRQDEFDRGAAEQGSQQAWPIEFTRDGQNAGFLQLTDDPISSAAVWDKFAGVYRTYPTNGAKAGATVFAYFSDPRTATQYGSPILVASQFYGSGRTMFIGTSELWRLRAIDEDYYDRFWTKTIREMGQARLKRGTNRGTLLLERDRYVLGQTVRIRAHLLDPQFHELDVDGVTMEVIDPAGRPMVPAPRLLRDKNRAGQYSGDFRASLPGDYRIEVPIPESADRLSEKVAVVLPNLESDDPRQNAQLLRTLAEETGGVYFPIAEAGELIPARLPNSGEQFQIDERLRTLWDRQWLLFLLVGFLSAEWLTRKLLKLA